MEWKELSRDKPTPGSLIVVWIKIESKYHVRHCDESWINRTRDIEVLWLEIPEPPKQ